MTDTRKYIQNRQGQESNHRKRKVQGSAARWGRSKVIESQKDEVDDHQCSALKIVRLAIHEDVVDEYNAEDAGPQVQVTE